MLNNHLWKPLIQLTLITVLALSALPVNAEVYDKIMVKIRNRVITQNEVELSLLQQKQQQVYLNKQDEIKRKEILNRLIEDTLLDIRADELSIHITDDELDNELDRFRKKNKMNEQTFEELLEHQKMTLADYRKMFSDKIRRSRIVSREIRSKIQITDEILKKEYENMESDSLQYRARHILRTVAPGVAKEKDDKAREEIIWVKEQLENGAVFASMADQYSQDPSVKQNHGDLGFFNPGDMVKEFSAVVSKLEKNTLSPPVRTQFGYHLIQVIDSRQAPKEPFEKMKKRLKGKLYQKYFKENFKAFINDMKKRIQIKHYVNPVAS